MWAWRPSVHKKYPIRAQLIAVIVGVHLVLLAPCFLLKQTQAPYHIQVNTALMNSSLPVVFVPFKEVASPAIALAKADQEQTAIVAPVPSKPKSRIQKKKVASKKQTKAEIKNKTALKTVALADSSPRSSKEAKAEEKKNAKKVVTTEKKQQQKGAASQTVALAKADKKIEEAAPATQVVKKESTPEIKQEVAFKQKSSQGEPINALRVSANDLEQLTMQNAIQSILSISWQPPVGLPDDVACQISFKVGITGEIAELAMIKPSGILMYDIAVQNALYESSGRLPRYSYGKEFCITFTQ